MSQIHLFAVASQQAAWLSARQSAIANNIANSNTPGFKPVDVEPFDRVIERTRSGTGATAGPSLAGGKSWEVAPSGNAVSLEQELIKADEVNRAYGLNAGVVKAFHRMLMMSVR